MQFIHLDIVLSRGDFTSQIFHLGKVAQNLSGWSSLRSLLDREGLLVSTFLRRRCYILEHADFLLWCGKPTLLFIVSILVKYFLAENTLLFDELPVLIRELRIFSFELHFTGARSSLTSSSRFLPRNILTLGNTWKVNVINFSVVDLLLECLLLLHALLECPYSIHVLSVLLIQLSLQLFDLEQQVFLRLTFSLSIAHFFSSRDQHGNIIGVSTLQSFSQ